MGFLDTTGITDLVNKLKTKFQSPLVSGVNIKTINRVSVLGYDNISITSPWTDESNTAASVGRKEINLPNSFSCENGTLVAVRFKYANTYTSGVLTLRIYITGKSSREYDIYYNGARTSSTNTLLWDAGETVTFIYESNRFYFVCKSKAAIPTASTSVLGGVKVDGSSITISNGVISSSALAAYPVGSIYMSVNSTSPATLFGGTWVRLKDKFLLGAGDTYTAGDTGGAATHTLTTSEMPSHSHGLNSHTHSYNDYYANSPTGSTTIDFGNGYAKITWSTDYNMLYAKLSNQYSGTETWNTATVGGGLTSGTYSYNYVGVALGGSQAHTHTITNSDASRTTGGASGSTETAGSGSAFSIMPPYEVVYMWKRTA